MSDPCKNTSYVREKEASFFRYVCRMMLKTTRAYVCSSSSENSRTKQCSGNLNCFLYDTSAITERISRGEFQFKQEHETKVAVAIAQFDDAFFGVKRDVGRK